MVKICGITRAEDAHAALDAGADLLGFVLAESPRRVAPERVAEMLAALPGARGVAVLVSPTPQQALEQATRAGCGRVQVHGVERSSWPLGFPLPTIFAFAVGQTAPPEEPWADVRHWMLCDTARDGQWGGTGETFTWSRVAHLARSRPLLLGGGLDAANVGEALAAVRPFGVDASSRLESAPGIKDPERVRAFVAAVRRFDAQATG
jgi:phosphoribosylanthranilate isomerase